MNVTFNKKKHKFQYLKSINPVSFFKEKLQIQFYSISPFTRRIKLSLNFLFHLKRSFSLKMSLEILKNEKKITYSLRFELYTSRQKKFVIVQNCSNLCYYDNY